MQLCIPTTPPVCCRWDKLRKGGVACRCCCRSFLLFCGRHPVVISSPPPLLTLLGPQSRFGDKLLIIRVLCPHIYIYGSAVLKELIYYYRRHLSAAATIIQQERTRTKKQMDYGRLRFGLFHVSVLLLFCVCCVLHVVRSSHLPFFLPVATQYLVFFLSSGVRWPRRFFILERYKLCDHRTTTQTEIRRSTSNAVKRVGNATVSSYWVRQAGDTY